MDGVSLTDLFESARKDIGLPRPKNFHYPLLHIMRETGNQTRAEYNPEILRNSGINPEELLKLWAVAYAKETLTSDTSISFVRGITINRCLTCLEKEGEFAFKDVLPEDIKALLREKLESCGYKKGSNHDHPGLIVT